MRNCTTLAALTALILAEAAHGQSFVRWTPMARAHDFTAQGGEILGFPRQKFDVNASGDLAFTTTTRLPNQTSVESVVVGRALQLSESLRSGAAVSGGGFFGGAFDPQMADNGDVITYSQLTVSPNGSSGVFRLHGSAATAVLRYNDPLPDGAHAEGGSPIAGFLPGGKPVLTIRSPGYPGAPLSPNGVYAGDRTNGFQTILRPGDPAPAGLTFTSIPFTFSPWVSVAGNSIYLTADLSSGKRALVKHDGIAATVFAQPGDAVPSGDGVVNAVWYFGANASGALAYEVSLSNTSLGEANNTAIILQNGGQRIEAVRAGAAAPDGLGQFGGALAPGVPDANGRFPFLGSIAGAAVDRDLGVFYYRGLGNVTSIAMEGSLTPDQTATFRTISDAGVLTSRGQVAFQAKIRETGATTDIDALYLWDPLRGLAEVMRIGDEVDFGNLPSPTTRPILFLKSWTTDESGQLYALIESYNGAAGIYASSVVWPGDFNFDGHANAADLTRWKNVFGTGDLADADADSDSDGNDFLAWQRSASAEATAVSFATPEPSCFALIALAAVSSFPRALRCRRRSR